MAHCILIPAHNEEVVIQDTLNSLQAAGFEPYNIYIVDDLSTDSTYDICHNNEVNVITTPSNLGKAGAQQYAIKHFELCNKYKYVIMMDADTKVYPDFREVLFSNMILYPDVDLFVGQVTSAKADNIYSAYRAIEYTFSHEVIKKGQDKFGVIYVAPGCVSIYSTDILRHLVFDSSVLAEDMDLTIQVHKMKGRIKYLHDVKVITQDPNTIRDYHNQMMRWYRGFWQVVLKHGNKHDSLNPVSFYMLYLILDSLLMNRAFLSALGLIGLYSTPFILALIIDLCVFILIGLYASYSTRRIDLVYKIPFVYFLSFFNTYAYIRSFFEVIVLRKKNFGWNKVKRYGEKNEEIFARVNSPTDS
jgi:cellulose synthase/poly-beta-1,6-N-acetylglucosamine synthase-like glycosyltransferase